MFNDCCSLLVMSCDKYESAWHPFFELIKIHWKEHPQRIFLSTESKQYRHDGLDITVCNCDPGSTWSHRLAECLKIIKTEFIIFSLEDFFLQYDVDQNRILDCYDYMSKNHDVAVCRLKDSTNPMQVLGDEVIPDFYLAGSDVDYRLETQFAIWRKEILLSYIDETEDPWQFETYGTKRIVNTPYRFLWYKSNHTDGNLSQLIMPYTVGPDTGYGITWGKWLWKNKAMLKKHGIVVDMHPLGTLNPLQIRYRELVNKAVYQHDSRVIYRCFALLYRIFNKIHRIVLK